MTAAAPSLKRCKAAASTSYLGRVNHKRGRLWNDTHTVTNEYVESVEINSEMDSILL